MPNSWLSIFVRANRNSIVIIVAPEISKEKSEHQADSWPKPTGRPYGPLHEPEWVQDSRAFCPENINESSSSKLPPHFSPGGSWLFGHAQKSVNDQIIMSQDNLEGKLTEIRENISGWLLELVFHEWMARLEWAIEHEGEQYINPH
jgi:hypothetical protein